MCVNITRVSHLLPASFFPGSGGSARVAHGPAAGGGGRPGGPPGGGPHRGLTAGQGLRGVHAGAGGAAQVRGWLMAQATAQQNRDARNSVQVSQGRVHAGAGGAAQVRLDGSGAGAPEHTHRAKYTVLLRLAASWHPKRGTLVFTGNCWHGLPSHPVQRFRNCTDVLATFQQAAASAAAEGAGLSLHGPIHYTLRGLHGLPLRSK